MPKELPYFQFEPAAWAFGAIQDCSLAAKGAFIDLCALYWQDECSASLKRAKRRYGQELIDELAELDIIKIDGDSVEISFLDAQHGDIMERKRISSEAGKKSGKVRRKKAEQKRTPLEPPLNPPSRSLGKPSNENEQIKGDNIKGDNIKSSGANGPAPKIRPTQNQVKEFFVLARGTEKDALNFFDHYDATGWLHQGSPLSNWQSMARKWIRNGPHGGQSKPTTLPKRNQYPIID